MAGLCCGTDLSGGGVHRAVLDLKGQPSEGLDPGEAKVVVVVFVKMDCPISNRYAPEVRRLHDKFGQGGVAFRMVYPEGGASMEEIRQHAADYNYPGIVVRDPDHRLVKLCHARVTPEAAVLTPEGELLYHGRIDDRYVAFGKWRPEPSRRDLELAIQAALENRPMPASEAAVGCTIPPVE